MSATTYFGDVVTTGDTNIVQNFVSYGATTRFTSNILGNKNIGTPGAPFGNVFTTRSNNTTMNTSTIQASTVFLSGNVVASNAYQGGNLFTTRMNAYGVSNTFSLGATNVGIGTSGDANLTVQGNVYMSNVTTTNVSLYNLMNVSATMNTGSLVATGIVNPVYQIPDSQTLTNPFGGTPNWGSNVYYSGDGSTMVTFPTIIPSTYGFIYRFTSNVFGGYWDMINFQLLNYSSASPTFGYAAALSYDGNTLIVGTPGNNLAGVFRFINGAWSTAPAALIPGSFGPGQSFGSSVAISPAGDIAVVGNPGIGAVYVYTYSAGIWSSAISLNNSYGPGTYFGYSVAISGYGPGLMGTGYTIIVGAPGAPPSQAGVVLYGFDGSNFVGPNGIFPPFSIVASDYLGYSVAISSDGLTAVAGAPYYASGAGCVVGVGPGGLFTLVSGAGFNFGTSVALSADGLTAVVGAPNASSGTGYAAKYTYSEGTWNLYSLVYAPAISQFGKSVAVSLNGILVGSASEKIIFYSFLGYPTGGANLNITGNVWVSNVILTRNVYATLMNAATINTNSITTQTIDVGQNISASTFEVLGNVFASNALVTQNVFANIYSTNANVQTLNASSVVVTGTTVSPTVNAATINVLSISATLPLNFSNPLFRNTSVYQFPTQATSNQFGYTVSLSSAGNVAAIGMNTSTGNVYVYRYTSGSWNLDAIIPSPIVGGGFGFAVSISGDGNTIVVGSANYSTTGYVAGYKYTGGVWVGPQTFPQGPNLVSLPTNSFGRAVSVSGDGNTAVVGAPYYSANFGWAGFYSYSGGAWVYGFNFNPTGLSGTTLYGEKVCISYDAQTALIAGTRFSTFPGYVRAFKSPDWSIYTELQGSLASWRFGSSLGLSADGTRAIVCANNQQFAGVYTYTAGTGWSNYVRLTANGSTFGQSAALSADGNTAIVGASGSSLVSIYYLIGGSWSGPVSLPTQPGTFGFSVSMSSDSKTLLVGAPTGTTVSAAYIYTLTESSNIFASNALSGSNLTVTNTIYYNEDLTKRSLYLTPNSTNAPAIQSAISATCNASTKSYWCTSPKPVYGNVISVSATSNAYSGGVYLPDGRVVFVTSNCTNIGIFNPTTSAFTSITGVQPGYNGGVLLPNGNVFFAPQTSNIGLFNPVTSKFSNNGQLYGQSYNSVLAPDGVWLTPSKYSSSFGASQIALYNNQVSYAITTQQLPVVTVVAVGTAGFAGVSVAWSAVIGKFVSITNSGQSYYSSDGKTWTLSTGTTLASIDTMCFWFAVAASPNKFVATGGGGDYNSAYSTDGINWNAPSAFYNPRTINSTMYWQAVAYNSFNDTFVAMGGGGNPFAGTNYVLTPDGVNWDSRPAANFGVSYTSLTCDFYGNPLAVSSGGGGAWYFSGGSWTPFPPPGGGLTTLQDLGAVWNSVAYSSTLNIFVAVGSTNYGSSPGSAWVPAPPGTPSWGAASPSLSSINPFSEWYSVTWSPVANVFVAVGGISGGGSLSAFSRDGKSWYAINPAVLQFTTLRGVAWSVQLGLWAAIGTGDITNTAYLYLQPDGYNTGSVLLPSGAIMFSPIGSANVMSFQQGQFYLVSNIVVGTDVFNGMVLAPNGNVITVPSGSNIYVINPTTGTSTNIGPIAGSVTNLFRGGALLPSGNVVFAPGTSANVGMFDPVALTYSNSVAAGTSGIAFSGATLLPNGQVVFTPYDSANVGVIDTFAPVSQEFCLSPYFNKF